MSTGPTLMRGEAALDRVRDLAEGSRFVAVEVNPAARSGEAPRLLAVATLKESLLIDPSGTPGVWPLLAAQPLLVAWEAKQVAHILMAEGAGLPERWACPRLTETLVLGGDRDGTDLGPICQRYGLRQPPDIDFGFEAMAAHATTLAQVVAAQVESLRRLELGRVSKIEAAAVSPITSMEHHGMCFDADGWRRLVQDSDAEKRQLRNHIDEILAQAAGGGDLFGASGCNIDSDSELKSALNAIGHPVPNVRRATVAALPAPLGPALGRYRELSKVVSAYGDSFLEHVAADGRLHPTFEQIGASTGRMSCHSPNLQAVVKGSSFRDCFRTQPGRKLVVADYATCELRILAEMSGDPVFLEAFERGDLHSTVATSLFHVEVSKSHNVHLRDRTKAVNFGLVYGMGAAGLARALDTDVDQARKLLEQYFETFPRIRAFLNHTAHTALQRGYAMTLSGRRLNLRPGDDRSARAQAERIAKNMPIQGTSADVTKIALARLHRRLPQGAFLSNAVHDEVVVECNEADAPAVADIVRNEMRAAGAELLRRVELDVDAEITDRWSK